MFRELALWDPPIDPALLVAETAQGLSLDSVLHDLNTPMPNYRFNYLIQKALELCNELKSMGSALLSVFEKKDPESIIPVLFQQKFFLVGHRNQILTRDFYCICFLLYFH